jgi:hypothetical protein
MFTLIDALAIDSFFRRRNLDVVLLHHEITLWNEARAFIDNYVVQRHGLGNLPPGPMVRPPTTKG